MSESESIYHKLMPVVAAILFMLGFAASGYIALTAVYTGVLLLCIYRSRTIKFEIFDIIIASLLLWELVLGIFTESRNNCIGYLTTQYIFTAYYFILRLTLTDDVSVRRFLLVLSAFIFAIAAISLVSFGIFRERIYSAGFENLYDFKHLYRPLGNLNNVWSTLVLVLSGITAHQLLMYGDNDRKTVWNVIPFALTLLCLLLSFSRGIYICMGLFIILVCTYIVSSDGKKMGKIMKCVFFIIFIISVTAVHKNDALRTIRLVETESQQRSLEGRLKAVDHTVKVFKEHPLTGVGTGNYSLAINGLVYENNNDSYTNLAPNVISQLLLEKGIIGTALWALVFIAMLLQLTTCKQKDKGIQTFIFLFLAIVFMREMSIATALTDRRIMMAVAILLALFQNGIADNKYSLGITKVAALTFLVLIMVVLCVFSGMASKDMKCYHAYAAAIKKTDYISAYHSLEKAGDNVTTNVLASSANLNIYRETGNELCLTLAEKHINKAVSLSPGDAHLSAFRAIVMQYLHGKDKAIAQLDSLISRYPANATYRIMASEMTYSKGERECVVPHLTQAIISAPSILESRRWQEFAEYDPETSGAVVSSVRAQIDKRPEDPILLSRYGKLLYLTGNEMKAEEYLSDAASMLPNLKTPWVYLSKIVGPDLHPEVSKHLKLWGYTESNEPDERSTTENADYSSYDTKSRHWYGYPLYSMTGFRLENKNF